jgi:hypothetical protein
MSIPAEHRVLEPLYLRHDSRFVRLGAVRPLARRVEQVGLRFRVGGKLLVVGACRDTGLVSPTPLDFQIAHLGVKIQV